MRSLSTVLCVLGLGLLGLALPVTVLAQDTPVGLSHWTPLSSAPTLWGIAASPSRVVTVGRQGSILISDDGRTWERVESGVQVTLTDVAFDAGEFLVTGLSNTFLRSTEGRIWSASALPGTNDFLAVSRQDGRFLVTGRRGILMTSRDGVTWTKVSTGTQVSLNAVAQAGTNAVAVGDAGTILVSHDGGDTWKKASAVTGATLTGVRYLKDAFVIVGSANTLLRSKDGTVWNVLRSGGSTTLWDAVVRHDEFLAAGSTEIALSSYGMLTRSTNLTSFVDQRLPTGFVHGLADFGGALIAIGSGGLIARSEDADVWSVVRSTPSDSVWRLTASPEALWATVDAQGDLANFGYRVGRLYASGIFRRGTEDVWKAIPKTNTPALIRCVQSQEKWVGIGDTGRIWVSPDGVTWRTVDSGSKATLLDLVAGDGLFVAVGEALDQGVILTSLDGETWTSRPGIPKGTVTSVAYGDGMYVAVGSLMTLVSTNGLRWELQGGIGPSYVWDVAYGNGRFVSTDAGNLRVSVDGRTWKRASAPTGTFTSVTFGAGVFVAAGVSGVVSASVDGVTWTEVTRIGSETLRTVLWSDGRFIVGGDGGVIAQSDLLALLPPQWIQVPYPVEVGVGTPLTLSGLVAAGEGVTYQWYKDGVALPGEVSATLDLGRATPAHNGYYSLVASNRAGVIRTPEQRVHIASPGPLDHWEVVRQVTGSINLDRCAVGAGHFVGITATGGLATSTDGVHWTESSSPTRAKLTGVQFEQAQFLLLGEGGFLGYSTEGQNWAVAQVPTDQALRAVAYHAGTWVAVGDHGSLLTSSDLRSWQSQTSPTTDSLRAVIWDGAQYTAVGDQGTIVVSVDATRWTEQISGTDVSLTSVASANGVVVAVGEAGVVLCRGLSGWTTPLNLSVSHQTFRKVLFWQGKFRLVGPSVHASAQIVLSGTGSQAIVSGSTTLLTPTTFSDLCADAFKLYAVAGPALMYWDSTKLWTPLPVEGAASLRDLAELRGNLVAVGDAGTVVVSTQGTAWRTVNSGVTAALAAVASRPDRGVIVGGLEGDLPVILTSSDATEWTRATPATTRALVDVSVGTNRFLALDDNGGVTYSDDGTHWVAPDSSVNGRWKHLAYGDGRFWALASGSLWNSADGLAWISNRVTQAVLPDDLFVNDAGAWFVDRGRLFYAPEGGEPLPTVAGWQPWNLRTVRPGQASFAALAGAAFPILSLNGVDWYGGPSLQPWELLALKYLRGACYAVGTYGVIMRSTPEARLDVRYGTVTELRLDSTDGRTYRVEYAEDLAGDGTVWRLLEPPTEGGPRWRDPGGTSAARRFYRAVLEP